MDSKELAGLLVEVGLKLTHADRFEEDAEQLAKFRGALILAREYHGDRSTHGCKPGGFPSTLMLEEFFLGYDRISVRCESCGFTITYEGRTAFEKGWNYGKDEDDDSK